MLRFLPAILLFQAAGALAQQQGGNCTPPTDPGCFTVEADTRDSGGERLCDAVGCIAPTYEIQGTIGQGDAHAEINSGGGSPVFQLFGGFWYAQGPVLVPVELGYVRSQREGGRWRIDLASASNAGTVAFQILDQRGRIAATIGTRGDSLRPEPYSLTADLADSTAFSVRALDADGTQRDHGPFAPGQVQGNAADTDWQQIDWAPARAERDRAEQRRLQRVPGSALDRVDLGVNQTGVQVVRFEQLLAGGWTAFGGIPVEQLRLSTAGQSIAMRVRSADASFGPGDSIEFIGSVRESIYGRQRRYRLDRAPGPHPRIQVETATNPVSSIEQLQQSQRENLARGFHFGAPGTDPWYEQRMVATGSPVRLTRQVQADGLAAGPAELRLGLWGGVDYDGQVPDHHVRVYLNQQLLGESRFDGLEAVELRLPLPTGRLRAGANTLELELVADAPYPADVVYLDTVQLDYSRGLLSRNGQLDFVMDQGQGAASTALLRSGFEAGESAKCADCRALQLQGFADGEVSAYRSIGLVWSAIDTQSSKGAATLVAVAGQGDRWWLASAAAKHQPKLLAVQDGADLLNGAASYLIITHASFLDELAPLVSAKQAQGFTVRVVDVAAVFGRYAHGEQDPAAIQAFLRDAKQNLGTQYVLLVGGDTYDPDNQLGLGGFSHIPSPNVSLSRILRFAPSDAALADLDGDLLPDVSLGRLPVRTATELGQLLGKMQRYAGLAGSKSAVLVSDLADGAANFAATQRAFGEELGSGWSIDYLARDELSATDVRTRLLQSVNQGVRVASYFGHSGPTRWSFDPILTADLVRTQLSNQTQPVVVLQWGCWTGYHVDPRFNHLAHAWLLQDAGASLVLGASGLTEAESDRLLALAYSTELKRPGSTFGGALGAAKRALGARSELRDVLLLVSLFGDPAQRTP